MKKIAVLFLTIVSLMLTLCSSGESPETSFEKFKQAACQGNADEVLSRVDFKSLALSNFKEKNPQATDADIKAYFTSEKYNEDVIKGTDNFKKAISQTNNPFCNFKILESKTQGESVTFNVQENPDNPYLIYTWVFKKNGSKWIFSDGGEQVNPPHAISSENLYKEYQTNVIAADQKYKGKVLEIKGKINQIGKDIANQVYFTVGSGIMGDVQCFVKPSLIDKVASLKPGQDIEVTGICNGKLMIIELKESVF